MYGRPYLDAMHADYGCALSSPEGCWAKAQPRKIQPF